MVNAAIGILERDRCILMIKRDKGLFSGLWGLPGGKVELNEHIDEAVIREFLEEAYINVEFSELLGVISEIVNIDESTHHSLLYCCELKSRIKINIKNDYLELIPISDINKRSDIIPSDKIILEELYLKSRKFNYLKIISNKINDGYDAHVIK
ncbi:NUDIX hydrolase [Clostridium tertium]|uniref:NUDIX hydrolase n=1 Tax=Clostridium tertium TaxID=1559 RepID=UPI0024B37CB4|nr:NUDIX domain-containing protein [Clostridium tertium]MDI9216414.1 NUDIX domain-containing protein [Clostridium tertium]